MSFFIVISKSIKEIDFHYLNDRKRKLDDTLVTPARQKVHHFTKDKKGGLVLAEEIMHDRVITVNHNATASQASKLFKLHNIHHAPVLKDKLVVGIISAFDLYGVEDSSLLQDELISQRMSQTVLCVSRETPLQHIIEVFLHEKIHALPVVDENFFLIGMITQNDLLKWMLKNKKYLK